MGRPRRRDRRAEPERVRGIGSSRDIAGMGRVRSQRDIGGMGRVGSSRDSRDIAGMGRVGSALFGIVVVVTGCTGGASTSGSSGGPAPTPVDVVGSVEHVIDGDTVIISIAGQSENVRLIGIDTPEVARDDLAAECYADEATARARALLPAGTAVRLTRDVEARDRFDRLLAYVFRADDGLFVNLDMVSAGYASPLTIAPNVTYADAFVAAAREARHDQLGLWAACDVEALS